MNFYKQNEPLTNIMLGNKEVLSQRKEISIGIRNCFTWKLLWLKQRGLSWDEYLLSKLDLKPYTNNNFNSGNPSDTFSIKIHQRVHAQTQIM